LRHAVAPHDALPVADEKTEVTGVDVHPEELPPEPEVALPPARPTYTHDDAEMQLTELTADTALGNGVADHVDPPSVLVHAGVPETFGEGPLNTQSPASGHDRALTSHEPLGRSTPVQVAPPSVD
jgi:hypothetical protein